MGWSLLRPRWTGWLEITDRVLPGWSVASLAVCRVGDVTVLESFGLERIEAGAQHFVDLPAGYLPPRTLIALTTGMVSPVVAQAFTNTSNRLTISSLPVGTAGSTYAVARTTVLVPDLAWPTEVA